MEKITLEKALKLLCVHLRQIVTLVDSCSVYVWGSDYSDATFECNMCGHYATVEISLEKNRSVLTEICIGAIFGKEYEVIRS